jgi:hypothetical protein
MNATVQISLADLDRLRNAKARAEEDVVAIKLALEQGLLADSGLANATLAIALGHALAICRFAIGNLDPLTVRGWPEANLQALAELFVEEEERRRTSNCMQLPGVDPQIIELGCDWRIFAARARQVEQWRAAGIEKEMLAEENSAKTPYHGTTD